MCLFVIFYVLISFLFNGCVCERHVLFIFNMKDTNLEEGLLKYVEQVAIKIFEEESDLKFKIIHPHEPEIVEITKSVNGTSSSPSISKSCNDFYNEKQSTLQNLQTWLQESPSNSIIYVITDDARHPSDQNLVHEILEIIQIKRTKVNFIVNSENFENHTIEEYRLISFVSNGLCMPFNHFLLYSQNDFEYQNIFPRVISPPNKDLNHQFADLLNLGLKFPSQKVTIKSVDSPGNGKHCFILDSFLTEVMAMYVNYERHPHPHDSDPHYTIEFTPEGKYIENCFVHSNPPIYSLRVIAKSKFNFIYGFSTDRVDTLDETYMRPIKGKSNRIYISLNHEISQARLHFFEIILRNGTLSRGNHLRQVGQNTDLFVGSFEPPNDEYFYIEVYSSVNGKPVTRMSSNAISAANGFGEDENNPKLGPDRIPLETYLLILISIFSIVILGEVVWIIKTYKKSSELPPTLLELEKPHPRARSNFYHPVSYNSRGQNVEII